MSKRMAVAAVMAEARNRVTESKRSGMANTMAAEVALMGQKLDTVCTTVAKIDGNVEALTKAQAATDIHVKSIIGPPSLEDRLTQQMDGKDSHKHANVMQAITGVQQILTLQQENATLKLESKVGDLASALAQVAKSVQDTEKMRKENHDAQLKWQEDQSKVREADRKEDATWKSGVERKINLGLGAVIGLEIALKLGTVALDYIKH